MTKCKHLDFSDQLCLALCAHSKFMDTLHKKRKAQNQPIEMLLWPSRRVRTWSVLVAWHGLRNIPSALPKRFATILFADWFWCSTGFSFQERAFNGMQDLIIRQKCEDPDRYQKIMDVIKASCREQLA
jgi:hypothetical protein